MAEKKEKDPFEGVETEALQDQKAKLQEKIAKLTEEHNGLVQELGRRASDGKQASLADCNAKAREAGAENRRIQQVATEAAEAAAKKAIAEAGKPKGGKKEAA